MANFLITSPNSQTTGTDAADLFLLNTALGNTVFGGGGADTISASVSTNFVNANLQGGNGNDTINVDGGGQAAQANFLLGNGSDLATFGSLIANTTTVVGGGGADTINLSAVSFSQSVINGNAGADLISASAATISGRSLIAGGGDNDVINLQSNLVFEASTINGGGGNDSITISAGIISAARIEGDLAGDTQFFGNDTITLSNVTASTINGGGGRDVIRLGTVGTGVRAEGNADNDFISVSNTVVSAATFLGGGAGNDTIVITAFLQNHFGTIQGGGGNDLISVSGAGASGGFILGGADADVIGLGSIAGQAPPSAGVNLAYASFSESNLAAYDVVSASNTDSAASTNSYTVVQSAVNFSVGAFERGGVVSGNNAGVATFTATFDNSLTARVTELDAATVSGQAVLFRNGAGTQFLFVQAGAAGGGAAGDLVVELNGSTAVELFATTNSALKVSLG